MNSLDVRSCLPLSAALIAAIAVAIVASPEAAGQSGEPAKKMVDVAGTPSSYPQGFSVVLLLGDTSPGGESQDPIPAAARRALVDMKDFLPYKSYRLLDSQWTLCCSGATSAITRLRGVDEQEYELELRTTLNADLRPFGGGPAGISMRFILREPEGVLKTAAADRAKDKIYVSALNERTAQINQEIFLLERERADLAAQSSALKKQVDVGVKDPTEKRRIDEQLVLINDRLIMLKKEHNALGGKAGSEARPVIDTSFRMDVGETVVVGTSRLKGGSRALIALLTAVGPRGKDTPKETIKR